MTENQPTTSVVDGDRVRRFNANMRVQHFILLALLIVLSFTGLTLTLHDTWIATIMIKLEGGFESRGWIHRASAVILMFVAVYHFYYVVMTEEGHREMMLLKPTSKDFADFLQQTKYNLGKSDVMPKFHKYSFGQKFQYWGLVLGVVFIAITGIPLWAKNDMMAIMPRWVMVLILMIHGQQGLLIFLVLFLWHVYNVHLRPGAFPWNPSFITGDITLDKLKEEHALEYEELTTAQKKTSEVSEGRKGK